MDRGQAEPITCSLDRRILKAGVSFLINLEFGDPVGSCPRPSVYIGIFKEKVVGRTNVRQTFEPAIFSRGSTFIREPRKQNEGIHRCTTL